MTIWSIISPEYIKRTLQIALIQADNRECHQEWSICTRTSQCLAVASCNTLMDLLRSSTGGVGGGGFGRTMEAQFFCT